MVTLKEAVRERKKQQKEPTMFYDHTKIYVKADADKATLEHLWNEAWKRSVVAQTITRGAKIIPEFEAV